MSHIFAILLFLASCSPRQDGEDKSGASNAATTAPPANEPSVLREGQFLHRDASNAATTSPPANEPVPEHLRRWPGLFVREGDKIVEAPPEDVAVAKSYVTFPNKGEVKNGYRTTIMTKKSQYRVDEEVRVIHMLEVVEPGHKVFVMGPKKIYGEYVDGRLVTAPRPSVWSYNGLVAQSPEVDYNYEITTYRFNEPGTHKIVWKEGVESNTLVIEVIQ